MDCILNGHRTNGRYDYNGLSHTKIFCRGDFGTGGKVPPRVAGGVGGAPQILLRTEEPVGGTPRLRGEHRPGAFRIVHAQHRPSDRKDRRRRAIRQAPQTGAVDAGGRCCRPARRLRRHGMAFPLDTRHIPGLREHGRCGDDRHARRRDARVAQRQYETDAARSLRPDAAQRAVGRRGLLRGGAGRSRPVRRVHRQTARARAGHLLLHAGLRRFAAGRSRPRTRFRTPSDARRGQPGDAATRPARPVRRCGRQPRHYAGQRFAPRADPVRPGDDVRRYAARDHLAHRDGVRLSVPGRYGDKRYTFNYQRSNSLEEVLNIVEYLTGEHCEVIYRKK